MVRQILAVGALITLAASARAQELVITPITTPQACFAAVDVLAQSYENHKYTNKAEGEKIGQSLATLEKQCEGNQLTEAQKTAGVIKGLIVH